MNESVYDCKGVIQCDLCANTYMWTEVWMGEDRECEKSRACVLLCMCACLCDGLLGLVGACICAYSAWAFVRVRERESFREREGRGSFGGRHPRHIGER